MSEGVTSHKVSEETRGLQSRSCLSDCCVDQKKSTCRSFSPTRFTSRSCAQTTNYKTH